MQDFAAGNIGIVLFRVQCRDGCIADLNFHIVDGRRIVGLRGLGVLAGTVNRSDRARFQHDLDVFIDRSGRMRTVQCGNGCAVHQNVDTFVSRAVRSSQTGTVQRRNRTAAQFQGYGIFSSGK